MKKMKSRDSLETEIQLLENEIQNSENINKVLIKDCRELKSKIFQMM